MAMPRVIKTKDEYMPQYYAMHDSDMNEYRTYDEALRRELIVMGILKPVCGNENNYGRNKDGSIEGNKRNHNSNH